MDYDQNCELLPAALNPGYLPEELLDLQSAFAQISLQQREVVIMVGVEQLTFKEAARRLGIPQGTVASRYRKALALMKEILEER